MQTSSSSLKSYSQWLLKWGLLIALIYFGKALFSNLTEKETLPAQTGIFLKIRMQDMLDRLPQLIQQKDQMAFFWGASEIESGLDTAVIDKVFKEVGADFVAVNVGMRNIHPVVYELFTKRVKEQLESENRKIAISFVKIPVNKLTKRFAAKTRYEKLNDQIAKLVKPSDTILFEEHPRLYFEALLEKSLFFAASPQVPSVLVDNWLRDTFLQPGDSALEQYYSIWTDKIFGELPAWNLERRGTYNWNLPASAAQLDLRLKQKKDFTVREKSYVQFDACCGMSSLNFDREMVAVFVRQVQALKSVSEKVILYTIPEEEGYNHQKRPEFERNQNDFLIALSLATDLPVLHMSDLSLEDFDYIDFLHLSASGQHKFYKALFSKANLSGQSSQ